jgi:hypothetical protein
MSCQYRRSRCAVVAAAYSTCGGGILGSLEDASIFVLRSVPERPVAGRRNGNEQSGRTRLRWYAHR